MRSKIVVGFLSYQRPALLRRALRSLKCHLGADVSRFEFLVLDNGSSESHLEQIRTVSKENNAELVELGIHNPPARSHTERDKRIALGFQKLAKALSDYDALAYILHEDDWECVGQAPFFDLAEYLTIHPQYGQLRLRRCHFGLSFGDCASYNFVTKKDLVWGEPTALFGVTVTSANLHWTNNPSLLLKKSLRLVWENYVSEIDLMKRFNKSYPTNIQLFPGIFEHKGQLRVRHDLFAKGVLKKDAEKHR